MAFKDAELIRHWKYLEEAYPISVSYVNRLRTGQTVTSGTVTVEDSKGNIVTAQFVSTPPTVTASPIVSITLLANGGVRGQLYYIRLVAVTQQPDSYEQVIELEIK